jgi:metal-responsive CopG/Arc/MetJ family transcriptional regulator
MSKDTHRINVVFPTDLLEELDEFVPSGKRSEVIVEATAAYLSRLKVLAALKETSGAWKAVDHPDMVTADDISRWLENLRSPWRRVPLFSEVDDSDA